MQKTIIIAGAVVVLVVIGMWISQRPAVQEARTQQQSAQQHAATTSISDTTARPDVFSDRTPNGTTTESYTLADVQSVTSQHEDGRFPAADTGYTLYTITLKSGVTYQLRAYDGGSAETFVKIVEDTGYTGDVPALLRLTKTSTKVESYTLADVASVHSRVVNADQAAADGSYTLYTITLTSGDAVTVRVSGMMSQSMYASVFRDSGYTGDVQALLDMAQAQ